MAITKVWLDENDCDVTVCSACQAVIENGSEDTSKSYRVADVIYNIEPSIQVTVTVPAKIQDEQVL